MKLFAMKFLYVFIFGVMFINCCLLAEENIYKARKRKITVDGKLDDWKGIKAEIVDKDSQLVKGKSLPKEKWSGDKDLCFQWRAAWYGNEFFFLIEVADEKIDTESKLKSFLNDCAEIFLDPEFKKGKRIDPKKLNGYEIHFMPTDPPKIFLDFPYLVEKPQNEEFKKKWNGEIVIIKNPEGYVVETGFTIPNISLKPGKKMGIEVVVCDSDGSGRESQMIWTGQQYKFWSYMDQYGTLILTDDK